MTYEKGQLINANDFNSFKNDVLNIYGIGNGNKGYGQTNITIPTISSGDLIGFNDEWKALRNVIDICLDHQGIPDTLLPPETTFNTGNLVIAHEQDSPSNNSYDFQNIIDNKQ